MQTLEPRYFNAGTLLDKGNQVFNVKAYGAKGDGATDDTANIQSAIAAAIAATTGSVTVYFPLGNYFIATGLTATLTAGKQIKFIGEGYGSILINGASTSSIANSTLVITGTTTTAGDFVTVKNLSFVGNATGGMGLRLTQCYQGICENLRFKGFTAGAGWGVGLYLTQTIDCTFNNIVATACGYSNIFVDNVSNANTFIGGWFYGSVGAGTSGIRLNSSTGNTFIGSIIETNATYGIICSGKLTRLQDCWIENNTTTGVYANEANTIIDSCWFTLNGLAVDVQAAAVDFAMTKNHMEGGGTVILRSGTARPVIRDNPSLTITDQGSTSPNVTNSGNVGINIAVPNSPLHVNGPIATALTKKTAAYTITGNDSIILADGTTAGFTVTLPDATSCIGRQYIIKKIDATTNIITIATSPNTQTIDGSTTITISVQYTSITLVSDGANWNII